MCHFLALYLMSISTFSLAVYVAFSLPVPSIRLGIFWQAPQRAGQLAIGVRPIREPGFGSSGPWELARYIWARRARHRMAVAREAGKQAGYNVLCVCVCVRACVCVSNEAPYGVLRISRLITWTYLQHAECEMATWLSQNPPTPTLHYITPLHNTTKSSHLISRSPLGMFSSACLGWARPGMCRRGAFNLPGA